MYKFIFMIKPIFFSALLFLLSGFCSGQIRSVNSASVGTIKHLVTSPSYKYVAVTGEKYVHLFDTDRMYQVKIFRDVRKPVFSIFPSDSTLLISGAKKTYFYDINSCKLEVLANAPYYSGYFDEKSNRSFLVRDKALDIYHYDVKESTWPISGKGSALCVSNRYIFVGYDSGKLEVLDKQTKRLLYQSRIGQTPVSSIASDSTERIVVFGTYRDIYKGIWGEAMIWDFISDQVLFRTYETHKDVLSVAIKDSTAYIGSPWDITEYDFRGNTKSKFSMGGERDPIFTINRDKMILGVGDVASSSRFLREMRSDSLKQLRRFGHDARQVWDMAIANDQLILIKDGEFSIVSVKGKVNSQRVYSGSIGKILKYPYQIMGITTMDYQKLLLAYDINRSDLRLIPDSADIIGKAILVEAINHQNTDYMIKRDYLMDISRREILLDFKDTIVDVVDLSKGISLANFIKVQKPHRKFIATDDRLLFYEFDRKKMVLNIRDGKSGKYLMQLKEVKKVFNQDATKLYYYSNLDSTLQYIDLENLATNHLLKIKNIAPVKYIKMNTKLNRLAIVEGSRGRYYDLATGKSKLIISKGKTYIECFAFSPNHLYLLSGNRRGEVELWDTHTGQYKGVIFTASLKEDYVIVTPTAYDGTHDGLQYLIDLNEKKKLEYQPGLLKKMLFD